jgi:electron transfer flavoprotein alpha subunit
MTVLIIAEHEKHILKPSTYATLTAAKQLSDDVHLIIAGFECKSLAEQAATLAGVKKVLWADAQSYQHLLAENLTPLIQDIAKDYTHILVPSTTFGKNLLPRLAAKLGVEQISDVVQVVSPDTFIRPIYAGNALTKVQSGDTIRLLTIRMTAFATNYTTGPAVPVVQLDKVYTSSNIHFVRLQQEISTRPELSAARVVIAGGRGLQSAENFKLLESIAEKLHAALGASRAAVDAGFVPNDYQVGQTGKVVAPELYIAVGISGAIQHVAGMKDSKVIVAINKDPDAPIFQIADYGLVGDLFTILPEFDKALMELK